MNEVMDNVMNEVVETTVETPAVEVVDKATGNGASFVVGTIIGAAIAAGACAVPKVVKLIKKKHQERKAKKATPNEDAVKTEGNDVPDENESEEVVVEE